MLVAGACLAWAVDNSVTAELDELTPAQITFVKGLVAGAVNTTIGLASAPAPRPGLVVAVLAVGALGYGASITLWVASARDLGAARAQVVFATAPFLGAVLAWTAFGEPVVTGTLVGCLLAGAGVALVVRSGHTHAHSHPALEHDHEHEHGDGHHDHEHPDGFTGRHQHPHRHEESGPRARARARPAPPAPPRGFLTGVSPRWPPAARASPCGSCATPRDRPG